MNSEDEWDHDGGLSGGHEHGEYWPPRKVVRRRPRATLADLIDRGHENSPAARATVTRLRKSLDSLEEIDSFVDLCRRLFNGDSDALAPAGEWIEANARAKPSSPVPTGEAGLLRMDADGGTQDIHLGEPGERVLAAEQWVDPSALLDLVVGAGFAVNGKDRRALLGTIADRLVDAVRPVAVAMTILEDLQNGQSQLERFNRFVDRFDAFGPLEDIPLDFEDCLGELFEVISRPSGVLSSITEVAPLEIDGNTTKIGSLMPQPVCTGARLTIIAKTGEVFTERSAVTVAFAPCGQVATDITWTSTAVSVTVPRSARSGPVYFAQPDTSTGLALAEKAGAEFSTVLGGCPFLAAGAATSQMAVALRDPQANARCFLPLGVGVPAIVVQASEIALFRALAADGSQITSSNLPAPDSPITIEWEVLGDPAAAVTLFEGGLSFGQVFPLRGSHAIAKAQATKTYRLVVTGNCGLVQEDLTVPVLRGLHFAFTELSIPHGQVATLKLVLDQVSATDTSVILHTVPSHPTAPGWVTILAGQSEALLNYPNLSLGSPGEPALRVTAEAPGYSSATARIWVNSSLGTHEIVADHIGGGLLSKIDVVGVHAALMPNESVLLFAYDEAPSTYFDVNTGKCAIWDPVTGGIRPGRMSRNLFCAGHAFLGDGRLLVAGGQSSAIRMGDTFNARFGRGVGADHDLHTFDGAVWRRILPDMPFARWYPTCTTLPDGRVLIVSGYAAHAYNAINGDYEIFDGVTNSLVKRAAFKTLLPYDDVFDVYPFVHILPGQTLFVHNHDTTWLLPLNASNEPQIGPLGFTPFYNAVSPNSRTYPGQGASVLLPLDPDEPTKARVLIVGGGGDLQGLVNSASTASNSAEIFEFDSSLGLEVQSGWRFTHDAAQKQTTLSNPRLMGDAVVLPDRTVAVIGGAAAGKADDAWPPVMWIESFDSVSEEFANRAAIAVPRLYHSTAMLLPNGSVMIAGSTGMRWHYNISGGSNNEFRVEVYNPPYLFRGPKPSLRLASTSLHLGAQLTIEIPTGAKRIGRIALIRHGSTTHTNNMDQRYVGLRILSRTDGTITVALPPDGSIAPPGPYLLFVIADDSNGQPVPSKGTSVILGS